MKPHVSTDSDAPKQLPGDDVHGNHIAEESDCLIFDTSEMLPLFGRQAVKLCVSIDGTPPFEVLGITLSQSSAYTSGIVRGI